VVNHPAERPLRLTRAALRRIAEIVGVGAVALTIYFIMPFDEGVGVVLAGLVVVATIGALVPLSIRRAGQVMASDQPLLVAAQSLFTMMTILIVSFSSVYYVLGTHTPYQIQGIATKIDALYFTITILSTVGFGDITATGQGARVLVSAHMIVNLVLLTIAIRLLSWAVKQRREVNSSPPGP
jgi:hypothetical protein